MWELWTAKEMSVSAGYFHDVAFMKTKISKSSSYYDHIQDRALEPV